MDHRTELVDVIRRIVGLLAPFPPPVQPSRLGDSGPLRGAQVAALNRARADLWAAVAR